MAWCGRSTGTRWRRCCATSSRATLWPVVEAPPPGVALHFIKATQSSRLSEDACARIEAAGRATGRVHLHRLEGGHWVHADNPAAVTALLADALP